MTFSHERGFTLVELAIVLMIIGLLIGGILRGQELMENARISSTAQQVTSYQGALVSFQDAYGTLPGDMPLALTRLPGCTAANLCVNGNGDGIVGVLAAGQGQFANEPWQVPASTMNSENVQFWKQLAMAKMVSGINPAAQRAEWGSSHPTSPMGGGFLARYTSFNVAGFTPWTGTTLLMHNEIVGGGQAVVSPRRASQLDRKMDDGRATFGSVWSISSNWENGCGNPNRGRQNNAGYEEGNEQLVCDMMFKIY